MEWLYDFDILFTTDNENFIKGIYPNQRVVTYNVKKPKKKLFTESDLFITDTFSFGTRIGQIDISLAIQKYIVKNVVNLIGCI